MQITARHVPEVTGNGQGTAKDEKDEREDSH